MLKLKNKLRAIYHKITGSLAFYPSIISGFLLLLAIVMLQLENLGVSDFIEENTNYIIIRNDETGRAILTTVIGGMISLMVFSFSMVMLLLNQASSNFSPRVLPGLISNKRHQFVLGFFLGTILYCLLVVINILPEMREFKVPGLAIFVGVILGIISLILFIYFLNSISKNIQIGHILRKLYQDTKKEILKELEKEERWTSKVPDTENWEIVNSDRTGYLQGISEKSLIGISGKEETAIRVIVPKGNFVIKNEPIIRIEKTIEEDVKEQLESSLIFNDEEHISQNFVLGFKQIGEIIVKAMSPGINDPGTAIIGIDYLSELFRLRMQLPDDEKVESDEGEVYIKGTSFEDTFYLVMVSIRQYSRSDVTVSLRILDLFKSLINLEDISERHLDYLKKQLTVFKEDLKQHIDNQSDRNMILELINRIE